LRRTGRLYYGTDNGDCVIDERRFRSREEAVLELLDRVAREADVAVIRLDDWLCDGVRCPVEIDGIALYRDSGHLSHDGSRMLGQRMQLADRIWVEAR